MRTFGPLPLPALVALGWLVSASPAFGQGEESSPSIELGSSRIGGPGLTDRERRMVKSWDEPDEYLTEETVPKPGSKKRLPALHTLAVRYVTTKQWKEACNKYDTIESEFGMEGVAEHPEGKKFAARAYFRCGRTAGNSNEFDKAEAYLQKSEKYGPTTAKHDIVREKMIREQYRRKMNNGDFDGAITLFNKAQKMREDEDERIWLGEKLAERAWTAYKTDDKITLEMLMNRLETIAPLNTEYRRLKDKIDSTAGMLQNAVKFAGAIFGLLVLWTLFSRWREKRRVLKAEGNPFEDL